ncbi:UMP kinase [candidate division WOR-3 bacterium]|nr:UMP kinase [candidate division WOR-3 bacterium]
MESKPKYQRILIKLSGEFLKSKEEVISFEKLSLFAEDIKHLHKKGVEIGIVVGGGNILRGLEGSKKHQISSAELDELGMIATMINGGALSLALKKIKIPNSILSAIPISPSVGDQFNIHKALKLLAERNVLIFVGGTSNPFFTTDTAAVLRALQIKADVLIKSTNVKGIYDKDPNKFPDARFYKEITYIKALNQDLKIMDLTAFSLAMNHNLPIIVFNGEVKSNLRKVFLGKNVGTIIKGGNNG